MVFKSSIFMTTLKIDDMVQFT